MTRSRHNIVITCKHCKTQHIVSPDAALNALIVWECAVCGQRERPVFAVASAESNHVN